MLKRSSMENVNFYTFNGFYFPVSHHILLESHILAHQIESFRTVYGLSSCIEIKMLILLGAHALRLLMENVNICTFDSFYFQSYVLSC